MFPKFHTLDFLMEYIYIYFKSFRHFDSAREYALLVREDKDLLAALIIWTNADLLSIRPYAQKF